MIERYIKCSECVVVVQKINLKSMLKDDREVDN